MMAFDNPGETFTDGRASDVHHLAYLEYVHADLAANFKIGKLVRLHAEFAQYVTCFNACLGEMARSGFVDTTGAAFSKRNLDRGIAIGFGRFDLGHAIIRHVDNGNRDGIAVIGKQSRHADLATDKS